MELKDTVKNYWEELKEYYNSIFIKPTKFHWESNFDYKNIRSYDRMFTSSRSDYLKLDNCRSDEIPGGVEVNIYRRSVYYLILKLLGFDVEYIVEEPIKWFIYNKNQSSTELVKWFNDNTTDKFFNTEMPCFRTVHVPYSNSTISTAAKEAMIKEAVDRLGLCDDDLIDEAWSTYFRPVDCTLFKVYYKKEVGTTVITDYEPTPSRTKHNWNDHTGSPFNSNLLNKLYYGQFLFRSEVPDDNPYLEDIEKYLINESEFGMDLLYNTRDENFIRYITKDSTYSGSQFDTVQTMNYKKLRHLLSLAYESNTELFERLKLEVLSINLNKYAQNQIDKCTNEIRLARNEYESKMNAANKAYRNYTDLSSKYAMLLHKGDGFAKDYIDAINKAITDLAKQRIDIVSTGIHRDSDDTFYLKFKVSGPAKDVDLDCTDIMRDILKHHTGDEEFSNAVVDLVEAQGDYELYFVTETMIDPTYARPEKISEATHDGYLSNPHIGNFNCWGTTPDQLRKLNDSQNFDILFSVYFMHSLVINVKEGITMERLSDSIAHNTDLKCVRNKVTGEVISWKQYCDEVLHSPYTDEEDDDDNNDDDDEGL